MSITNEFPKNKLTFRKTKDRVWYLVHDGCVVKDYFLKQPLLTLSSSQYYLNQYLASRSRVTEIDCSFAEAKRNVVEEYAKMMLSPTTEEPLKHARKINFQKIFGDNHTKYIEYYQPESFEDTARRTEKNK